MKKMKKKKHTLKNKILISTAYVMAFTFAFSVSAIDSINPVPFIVALIISTAWLVLFGMANGSFDMD